MNDFFYEFLHLFAPLAQNMLRIDKADKEAKVESTNEVRVEG